MKLIDNCTNLSNQEIGMIIDKINLGVDTIYYGKNDVIVVNYKKKKIRVEITYLKRYVKFEFDELKTINKGRKK